MQGVRRKKIEKIPELTHQASDTANHLRSLLVQGGGIAIMTLFLTLQYPCQSTIQEKVPLTTTEPSSHRNRMQMQASSMKDGQRE